MLIVATTRIQHRHPNPSKRPASIASDMYALARTTILAIVPDREPGIALNAYLAEVARRLPKVTGWDPSLSASWYAMAMKLDPDARGELKRINRRPPQRLIRTSP